MSFFLRPASPRALWKDLRTFWVTRPRQQWIAGSLALIIPALIVWGFFLDAGTYVDRRSQIYFVDSWRADRSDAEIQAKQKTDLADREAREEERRRQFQRLDEDLNRLGI
jgi:hypothetical protein